MQHFVESTCRVGIDLFRQALGREEFTHASLLLVERFDLRFDPRKVASCTAIARAVGGCLNAFVKLFRIEHGLLDHFEDSLLEEMRRYLGVAASLDLASVVRSLAMAPNALVRGLVIDEALAVALDC